MCQAHFKLQLHGTNSVVLMGFLPWEICAVFSRENQLQQTPATQPMVHAVCSSVAIIH